MNFRGAKGVAEYPSGGYTGVLAEHPYSLLGSLLLRPPTIGSTIGLDETNVALWVSRPEGPVLQDLNKRSKKKQT